MAARTNVAVDIDPEVASLLRERAADANVTEGEIVEQALRAFDLRCLVGQIRRRSDVDGDAADPRSRRGSQTGARPTGTGLRPPTP